jgi:hypothetical protein
MPVVPDGESGLNGEVTGAGLIGRFGDPVWTGPPGGAACPGGAA